MSHYTVAVFHRPDQDVDNLLAPFDENLEVDPYLSYTKQEAIDHVRQHWSFVMDGPKKIPVADATDAQCYAYIASDYASDMKDDDGNLYSTYNPNSKWDWYQEGGRWSGSLRLKSGGTTDSAAIRDLDFSPDKKAYEEAAIWWDKAVDGKVEDGEEKPFCFYKEEYMRERYRDRETYAKLNSEFRTYAVLTPDGVWHEPGQMGWFGCSSETPEDGLYWDEHYQEAFIDTADPDWILTVIDCHI